MPDDEGLFLHRWALVALAEARSWRIGSWCGKSAVYLGAAALEAGGEGRVVLTVDHHHGSEENQPGWEHHDPSLVGPRTGRIDNPAAPPARRTLVDTGLEDVVVPVVGDSTVVAAVWRTPLAMVFVDGGHGEGPAHDDYTGWARWAGPRRAAGHPRRLPRPRRRGPPAVRRLAACAGPRAGDFAEVPGADGACGSMRVLRRVRGAAGDPVS